ncbi:MAG: hypothetical protein H5U40_03070 [Polyangiaceae bacterium]|nr:hypothetical protein [Polyangiaceae bacterium]
MATFSTSIRFFGYAAALTLGLAFVSASTAAAQVPVPSATTPGMIGGQTISGGRMVLGASTGYPQTRFHVIWGMGGNFDLGIQPGITYTGDDDRYGYDRGDLSGLRQDVGLDLQVPLRWTLTHMRRAAVALRVSPFFRIGEAAPAFSIGSLVGARFSIALPKVFSFIIGPEMRFAFASLGDEPYRANGFDGAAYIVFGLESFFRNKWFFNLQFDGGGYYGSEELWNDGLFNAYVGFGALM